MKDAVVNDELVASEYVSGEGVVHGTRKEVPSSPQLVPWLFLALWRSWRPTSLRRELERDARGTSLDALVGLA